MADEGTLTWTGPGQVAESNAPENVNIQKVDNGFIVKVGCKTFVANSFDAVVTGLRLYYKDPRAAQKKYCK